MQNNLNPKTNPRANKNALKLKTAQNYVEERERTDCSLGFQISSSLPLVFQPGIIVFLNRIMEKTHHDAYEVIEKASYPESDNINPEKWDRCEIEMSVDGMLEIKTFSDFYILASADVDKYHRRIMEITRNEEKCAALQKEHYLKLASYARYLEQTLDSIDGLHLELEMLWQWQLEKFPTEMGSINECYSHFCRLLMVLNRFFVSGPDIEETTKGGAHA